MLVGLDGNQEELTCFEPDSNTEADYSCPLNWKNQLFIFGGFFETRQISRLSGHKLERVGDLLFDLDSGACSVMANQIVFLCFSYDEANQCRRSTGPLEQFSATALSTHQHREIHTTCSDSKFVNFLSVFSNVRSKLIVCEENTLIGLSLSSENWG